MFDFIPVEYYTAVYYHIMFFIMCIIFFMSQIYKMDDFNSLSLSKFLGYATLVVLILYMGLRPVNGKFFGDMDGYEYAFRLIQRGEDVKFKSDFVFNYFLWFCAQFMSATMFFLLIDFLYILPCYLFARKYCGKYWTFVFFMFLGSFSFWTYGTNGLRNGLATATFIFALYFYDRKYLMYLFFGLSIGLHKSLMIPVASYFLAAQYKNPKLYLGIWFMAIPLSLIGGSFWEGLIANVFSTDERATDYLTNKNIEGANFSSTGFRWDFLFYSSFAIFSGWYYIFKKKISDAFYIHLFGIYIIANVFWILVIRANFSNRFAYLSWFLMAPVIAYPLFKYKIFNDQFKVAGIVLVAYFMFTYLMFLKG